MANTISPRGYPARGMRHGFGPNSKRGTCTGRGASRGASRGAGRGASRGAGRGMGRKV